MGNAHRITTALANLGMLAGYQGNYARATALHAESLALRRGRAPLRGGSHAPRCDPHPAASPDRAAHACAVETARAALGEEAYMTAWAVGAALSPEEAIAEATEEPALDILAREAVPQRSG